MTMNISCQQAPAPSSVAKKTLKKRVSFGESNEVFAVERVDACLIQELFYSREDYYRFRYGEPAQTPEPEPTQRKRRALPAKATAVRREKLRSLVASRERTDTSSLEAVKSRRTASHSLRRQTNTLQGMRSHMRIAQQ